MLRTSARKPRGRYARLPQCLLASASICQKTLGSEVDFSTAQEKELLEASLPVGTLGPIAASVVFGGGFCCLCGCRCCRVAFPLLFCRCVFSPGDLST